MPDHVPHELPLAELYRSHRDAFETIARHVSGVDESLVYSSGLKGLVVDPAPERGRPCVLKPAVRQLVATWLRDGQLSVTRKRDAVHVAFRPGPRARELSHPVDRRTREQRLRDAERAEH